MHVVFLVEDLSGKKALELLVPKIIKERHKHTYEFRAYQGIGHIPKKIHSSSDIKTKKLLNDLPKMLQAYGKTFAGYGSSYPAAVFVICDLDNRTLSTFRDELEQILNRCSPKPETRFCIAIEEGEAWLLGDISAVKCAYPAAKDRVLQSYVNDSICGTWELLADAIHSGGSARLIGKNYKEIGLVKSNWAEAICPHIDVARNASPSFQYFRTKLYEVAGVV